MDLRNKAIRLRLEKEMSYSAIRKLLGVPKSTLSGWLKSYPLNESRILELRRAGWKRGEATRERFRNTMRAKQVKLQEEILSDEKKHFAYIPESAVYIAGLMLYAAEGAKQDIYRVSIANTDHKMIWFFISWLERFFGVKRADLRFQLHLYPTMDIPAEEKFWRDTLQISKQQFYKAQIRTLTKNSFTYRESFRHGTCGLYISSKDIKMRITAGIKAFMSLHTK